MNFYQRIHSALRKNTLMMGRLEHQRRHLEMILELLYIQAYGKPRSVFSSAFVDVRHFDYTDAVTRESGLFRFVTDKGETLIKEYDEKWPDPHRPKIVCLCGSTRFGEAYQEANKLLTLKGRIVLTIGVDTKSDADLFAHLSEVERDRQKQELDALHLAKIDLADEVLFLNVGDYIGDSTRRELDYARRSAKPVLWWEGSAHMLPNEEVFVCDKTLPANS